MLLSQRSYFMLPSYLQCGLVTAGVWMLMLVFVLMVMFSFAPVMVDDPECFKKAFDYEEEEDGAYEDQRDVFTVSPLVLVCIG